MTSRRRTPEEIQQAKTVAHELLAKNKVKDQERKVKNARITLIVLACLQAAVGLWEGFGPLKSTLAMGIDFGIGGAFLGMYFLSKTHPLAAFITALSLYAGIHLLIMAFDPSSIINGIVFKIVIIVLLVNGIRSAHALPKPKPVINDDLLDEDLDRL